MPGGGGQNTVQTTTQELAPEQRELLSSVIPVAKDFVQNPPQQFPGSSIAGFTPLQQQAQQMTLGAAQGMLPLTQNIPGQANNIMQGWAQGNQQFGQQAQQGQQQLQDILGFQAGSLTQQPGLDMLTSGQVLFPETNPALQAAMQGAVNPMIRNFERSILPGISSQAVASGGFGGTRQDIAEGIAASDLQQQIGDVGAQFANQAFGQGLNAMTQGLGIQQQGIGQLIQGQLGGQQAANQAAQTQQQGLAGAQQFMQALPEILRTGTLPAELVSAVGEQEQGMQQALLNEQVQRFINEQLIPFSAAQDVAALAFGMPAGSQTSQATTSGGGSGVLPFLQAGAGLATALPALFGLFSDRRVKKNIRSLYKLSDGLKVYRFEYLWAEDEQIGLMADEVFKKYPFAVSANREGVAVVNYGMVPTW